MTPPTPQRYAIVAITSMAALWMYIDRVCVSTLVGKIQGDLQIPDTKSSVMLGAFFFAYALCQIPCGSLADRYGQRLVLTLCIAAWSLVTMLTGFVQGFVTLLLVRLLLGIAEAGAYPAAAGLVKNWAQPTERGRFSSFVALGGRIGGAIAPFLTAYLALAFVGWGPDYWTYEHVSTVTKDGVEETRREFLNWRAVFVFFGICGLLVAVAFWMLVRNHPDSDAVAPTTTTPREPILKQLLSLATSRNMFLFAVVQCCVNIGWAQLVTLLPKFLEQRFQATTSDVGRMQSAVLFIGCAGMLLGGIVTDFMHQKYGPRWGRSIPVCLAKAMCVICCCLVPFMGSPWYAIFVLGAMAFFVDLGNPSIWAFAQDVGGKRVGAALGWGNTFGNLGAALSPFLLTKVQKAYGWDAAFFLSAGVFAIASVAGFLLNASRTLEMEANERRPAT